MPTVTVGPTTEHNDKDKGFIFTLAINYLGRVYTTLKKDQEALLGRRVRTTWFHPTSPLTLFERRFYMGPFPNPQYDISPDGQLGSEMIGKTILHYKIIEKLGEGGMRVLLMSVALVATMVAVILQSWHPL